jgi:YidC/Oxa1 family membrane protein insertase
MTTHIFMKALLLGALMLARPLWAQTEIATEQLRLEFGEQGQLLSARACFPDCARESARQVAMHHPQGLVHLLNLPEGDWQLSQQPGPAEYVLAFQGPGGIALRWIVPTSGYAMELQATNAGAVLLQADEDFRAREAPGFGEWLEQVRYLAVDPGSVEPISLEDTEVTNIESEWAGFRSRFWAVLMTADQPFTSSIHTAEANLDPILTSRGEPAEMNWHFYLGPVERASLAKVDELLPDLMYAGLWFWLRWICIFLGGLLGWLHAVVGVWGWSIMALSACVGVMMLPLSRIADRMQQQVNATEARLAPELARLKQEFKGEEQASKILAHYKAEGVHPLYSLKSLLGVAVVIPVFIGAFDMLAENIQLMNTPFLWIDDLSRPDHLFAMPFDLPFFGAGFNLLPWLMTGLSVWASLLHKPLALQAELRQRQVRNMILLAAAFFVLFYTFPAGMVLYWTTNNLISVAKSLWAGVRAKRLQSSPEN